MNLYCVTASKFTYGDICSMVVIAESKEQALNLVQGVEFSKQDASYCSYDRFDYEQNPLTIEEISLDINEPDIVLIDRVSF